MKITTKIAKNGAVNIYLDGKRVKEEVAVDTLCDNGGKIYFADIHGYTGHTITATFASSISAYKWLIKMGNKSINYADGSWLIDCKDYKTGEIVTILEKDERDYVINDPQLKAFCNGKILEVTQEVVTDDAEQEPEVAKFEVGKTYFVILDGQTITAKVEDRTAKMLTATTNEGTRKYHIHETIDAEHINLNGEGLMIWAQCEFTTQNVNAAKAELQTTTNNRFYKQDDNSNLIQISYEQAQAEADEALAKFCGLSPEQYNEINNEESQVEPDTEPQVDPIIQDLNHNLIADHITGIKEEQPMTDKLIFSTKENADGKITAYYINGEKVRKCDIEYYACTHSGIIVVDYHLAQNFHALKYPGDQRKVVYTDYYGQTLMSKAAADELGYKIVKNNSLEIFYVEPIQTDNIDDGSNGEEPALIVETKRTKRDSINLKLNGSRISLRNLEERLSNAANENFSVINQYGKKYSCYPANNYGYFGESPEGYTIHFNTLGELIEHYAVDNIIHTAEPADNPTNDTQDTDQPIDPPDTKPVNTLATGVAKYQAEFEKARQISVHAGSSFYNVNGGETIHFNYGEVRAIFSGQSGHSDHYKAEIIFKNGKKHFRYDGISVSRTAFLKIITDARAETTINTQTTDDELIDPPVYNPFTDEECIDMLNHNINWAKDTLATMQGDIYSDDWQDWTRAELEQAIEDWTEERDDLIIKSGKHILNHKQKKNLRDSLERAKQIACRNIRSASLAAITTRKPKTTSANSTTFATKHLRRSLK